MKRVTAKGPRTQRLNLCLTPEDRRTLRLIADREMQDDGFVASFLVEWAIQQYMAVGASLVFLNETQVVRDERIARNAKARLLLRQEAAIAHESVPETRLEKHKKRA